MLKADTTYNGLELLANPGDHEAMHDMKLIVMILKKNNIKVGGYDYYEAVPSIEMNKDKTEASLYLGQGRKPLSHTGDTMTREEMAQEIDYVCRHCELDDCSECQERDYFDYLKEETESLTR